MPLPRYTMNRVGNADKRFPEKKEERQRKNGEILGLMSVFSTTSSGIRRRRRSKRHICLPVYSILNPSEELHARRKVPGQIEIECKKVDWTRDIYMYINIKIARFMTSEQRLLSALATPLARTITRPSELRYFFFGGEKKVDNNATQ
ncbi:hypothetical protein PUN28_010008 [Cardiocondyla obscurior]|uniref:Uncharacterized protein n=1 Tax=Cardiocondyla obscurior TaxID=286306 RepID=A0AAW2FR69_9HYME